MNTLIIISIIIAALLAIIAIIYGISVFSGRSYAERINCSCLMNTEQNENITFNFSFARNISPDKMVEKINTVLSASEKRRQFQFDRVAKMREENMARLIAMNEKESNISELAKKKHEKNGGKEGA